MRLPLRKRFGQRVKELRLASGLSQEAFADRCGFARSYMSRVERGGANPSLDAVEVLADALHVEVYELFQTAATELPAGKTGSPAVSVPFAADGSCFNPSLRRPRAGTFTVGNKNNELTFDTFDAALEFLKAMDTAQWRRPNKAGRWGRVVAVRWGALPKKYSTH